MKSDEGRIGLMGGVVMIFAVLSAKLFVQYPTFLIEEGGPAAWQVAFVATITGLLLFVPAAALSKRFPGTGLGEISQTVAGPVAGTLFSLLVGLWLFATLCIDLRNVVETFIGTMLPATPPSVLMATMLGCLMYSSYRGIESLSRAAQILLPLIAIGVGAVLVFSLPRTEVDRLFPLWGHGALRTIGGGVYYSGLVAEVILLLVIGYAFADSKTLRRSGYWAILLFGVVSVSTLAVLVTVFGSPEAARQPFPLFDLARMIYLGRFMQRTEAILVMFWFFTMAVRLAALFYGTVSALSQLLDLPYYRPVIFPVGLLAFSLALVPKDMMTVVRLVRDWLDPLGIGIMLIPAVLLALALLRGKGGKTREA